MTDDELLAQVMRRCLSDEDMFSDLWAESLTLDGHVRITPDEHAALLRVGAHRMST